MTIIHRVSAGAVSLADNVPVAAVIVANATMPWWRLWLLDISELATIAGQFAAVALAVYKLITALQAGRGIGGAARDAAAPVAIAAKAASGAKAFGLIGGLLAIVGTLALLSRKADAMPSQQPRPAVSARKRSDDDAGDDDEVDAPRVVPEGPLYYKLAYQMIGLKEEIRGRSNPAVAHYYTYGGLPTKSDARKVPWCMCWLNGVLEKSGYPGSKSAMARSALRLGTETDEPRRGDIVVFWRGRFDDGTTGHVGFVHEIKGDYVYCLGGNQGDAVSIARFHKSRVLAYRRPRKPSESTTARAAAGSAGTGATAHALNQVSTEKAQTVLAAIEPVKGSLSELAPFVPVFGVICAVLSVALALYAAYRRIQDFKSRGI